LIILLVAWLILLITDSIADVQDKQRRQAAEQ
jgi:hypothetical protein